MSTLSSAARMKGNTTQVPLPREQNVNKAPRDPHGENLKRRERHRKRGGGNPGTQRHQRGLTPRTYVQPQVHAASGASRVQAGHPSKSTAHRLLGGGGGTCKEDGAPPSSLPCAREAFASRAALEAPHPSREIAPKAI